MIRISHDGPIGQGVVMRKTMVAVLMLIGLFGAAGADWTSIGPEGGLMYCGVAVPGSPPSIYVSSTNNSFPLLKSTNYGASWATFGAGLANYPRQLARHPTDPNTIYGIVSSIFYRTTDAGLTWTQSSLGSNIYGEDIAVNPLNPQVIYLPCYKWNGSAWKPTSAKSTNGGTSWVTTQMDTLTSSTMYAAAIDPVDTAVVYMGGWVNNMTVVYKSTDCGATWSKSEFGANYYYVYSLLVSPTDHNIVFAGTLNGVFRSTDAGLTWNRQSSYSYNYSLKTAPGNPNIMYSAGYSYVLRSTDAGLTWAYSNSGLVGTNVRLVLVVPDQPATVFCASTAGMFKSTDYGVTWAPANNGIKVGNIPAVAFDPGAPGTAFAEFIDNAIFKTTDDGATWMRQPTVLSCGNVCSIVFDPANPQRRWMLEASG
jgi:photosystem II stability/assembly factor-like uncharacterized protein